MERKQRLAATSVNQRVRCRSRNAPPSPVWLRAQIDCRPGQIALRRGTRAITRSIACAISISSAANGAQAEEIVTGSRQNAQGQTYAVDYIRQQVIAAVGWDRAMNEGFRIHTTID